MARIDAALHGLQPIAFLMTFRDEALVRPDERKFPSRARRLLIGRAHIGPEHAALLDQRISGQLDLLGVPALGGLGGNVDALARRVEFPAVVGAAQAAFLVAPEPERDSTVRAELVDETERAFTVAKRHQP